MFLPQVKTLPCFAEIKEIRVKSHDPDVKMTSQFSTVFQIPVRPLLHVLFPPERL